MVGEMETKEKPKPTPDYLMQLMNDKKLMSSLPNFCGIFNHLERLLDEGESSGILLKERMNVFGRTADARRCILKMSVLLFLCLCCCKKALKFGVKNIF